MPQIAEGKKQKWKPYCASIHDLLTTFSQQFLLEKTQKKPRTLANVENTGRHDWTRTNDPYHVKVVL